MKKLTFVALLFFMLNTSSWAEKKEYIDNAQTRAQARQEAKDKDVSDCATQAARYYEIVMERAGNSVNPEDSEKQNSTTSSKFKSQNENMQKFYQACNYSLKNSKDSKNAKKIGQLFKDSKSALKASADSGDKEAQIAMSAICKQQNNETESVEWLEKVAQQGDADAQYQMGLMYFSGACGVAKDENKAFEYFKQAADNGSRFAAIRLSYMFREGIGTSKDHGKAVEYMKKAKKVSNMQ